MRRSKHTYVKVVLVLAAMAGLTGIAGNNPSDAATLQSLTFPLTTIAGRTCASSVIYFGVNLTGTKNDSGGLDYIAAVTYEGNGTPIAYLADGYPFALSNRSYPAYAGDAPLGNEARLVDLAFTPVTVKVYDISAAPSGSTADQIAAAEASPLLAQASFDPRTDPNLSGVCAYLPFATVSIPALSPVGLAVLIGLLALGAVALLRERA